MQIVAYKLINHKHLLANFTVLVPEWNNVKIDMQYYSKDASNPSAAKWVSMPQRDYVDAAGQKKYWPLLRFDDTTVERAFKDRILKALTEYIQTAPQSPPTNQNHPKNSNAVPF